VVGLVPEVDGMTYEGCQLTPGCGKSNPSIGTIHELTLDYGLHESSLPDPAPGADGIWLGLYDTHCYAQYNPVARDSDQDGLWDYCEYVLAKAFAPMLSKSLTERCFGGEPYWAAKYFDNVPIINTGDFVRLAYMPAYYRDCGGGAHDGDSEFIQFAVGFNPSTQHWEFLSGFLSAHTCVDDTGCGSHFGLLGQFAASQDWLYAPDLEYPANRYASYPRVYVSKNKHANYATEHKCDTGGFFHGIFESCDDVDKGRFKVWRDHNIGSYGHPFHDCVPSADPAATSAELECFWSPETFGGWQLDAEGVTPYVKFLNSFAFACKWLGPGTSWCSSYGL
jgi:hypothetical protein